MKLIFTFITSLIVKIASCGVERIHMRLSKNKCIHDVSLFGADFGLEASLNEAVPSVTVTGVPYRDMIKEFFLLELDDSDVDYPCGFNRTVPHMLYSP